MVAKDSINPRGYKRRTTSLLDIDIDACLSRLLGRLAAAKHAGI
jgi:hypothetical protein